MSHGVVVWITGLPSAGKSTLAERALARLKQRGVAVCLLDGDAVRAELVPRVGYTPEERQAFYATLGNLAALLARQGLVVLVAATANRRAFRAHAREVAPAFREVWVATPPEECMRRDSKGLYAASQAGATANVPGLGDTYEPPEHPDVTAAGGRDDRALLELCAQVLPPGTPPAQ